jgi:hypothetical protein
MLVAVSSRVAHPPPYTWAVASTSAPAFNNKSAISTMFFGVF